MLACLGVALLAGCSSGASSAAADQQAKAPGVALTSAQRKHIHLYTVEPRVWHKTLDVTGTVDYDHDQATRMLAPISGQVTRVLVAMGDTVKKGQVLARVDSSDFAQAIGDYRQALAQARTNRKLAEHAKDLLAHQGISANDAAAAQNAAIAADTARDAARQKLQALGVPVATLHAIDAGKTVTRGAGVIRAPIAGTVVARSITPGQHIAAGDTPCFEIADLSRMWVKARLFAADMDTVATGDAATLHAIDAGKTVTRGAGVIRAPIAGTVVARSITPGQHIAAGDTPCFEIADLSRMWVKARLFAADMDTVATGDAATVSTDTGGKPLPGKVTAVSAMVDPATGAATARIELANPHGVLKKGMYVRARIAAGASSKGLLAPLSAVLRDDDNRPFVYVAGKSDHFLRQHVGLGDHVGKDVVITSGLAAGRKIVSEGGIFLRFMQSQ